MIIIVLLIVSSTVWSERYFHFKTAPELKTKIKTSTSWPVPVPSNASLEKKRVDSASLKYFIYPPSHILSWKRYKFLKKNSTICLRLILSYVMPYTWKKTVSHSIVTLSWGEIFLSLPNWCFHLSNNPQFFLSIQVITGPKKIVSLFCSPLSPK